MSKKNEIRGKFPYKEEEKKKKKDSKKLKKKALTKESKKSRKRAICNHLDSQKNKTHFKEYRIGEGEGAIKAQKCKICGGILIAEKSLLTKESLEMSVHQLYTIYSIIRNKYSLSDKLENQIIQAAMLNDRVLKIVDQIENEEILSGKKRKNNNKKKKNKKQNVKRYRLSY